MLPDADNNCDDGKRSSRKKKQSKKWVSVPNVWQTLVHRTHCFICGKREKTHNGALIQPEASKKDPRVFFFPICIVNTHFLFPLRAKGGGAQPNFLSHKQKKERRRRLIIPPTYFFYLLAARLSFSRQRRRANWPYPAYPHPGLVKRLRANYCTYVTMA